VEGYLEHLCPGVTRGPLPEWPPDAFGLAAAVLKKSGAYQRILESNWPPAAPRADNGESWAAFIRRIGLEWRGKWRTGPPEEVAGWWSTINSPDSRSKLLSQIAGDITLTHALMQICACADEACYDVGMLGGDFFKASASAALLPRESAGSTLCRSIDRSRLRVLPKMHTAQSGLTIRSVSQNLSLCYSEEVVPFWLNAGLSRPGFDDYCVNLLIVPWPEKIRPAQFQATKYPPAGARHGDGLFTYVADAADQRTPEVLGRLLEKARQYVGRIDGVVLPEMALSVEEHAGVLPDVLKEGAFLIAGVGDAALAQPPSGWKGSPADQPAKPGSNTVRFDAAVEQLQWSYSQAKHHRWKVEKNQIMQYGLGNNLYPECDWWEHISVGTRELWFVALREWLTLTTLICEDLARPDPAADLVRAVGPNLVIALLMDGPQLNARWPARYATVLADDPGCSVLSITSLGMSELSRARDGSIGSRVIALWKDALSGAAREIELPKGASAIVLNITVKYEREITADGRHDEWAAFPILGGYHAI
jgi:hypothetical protein